MIFPSEFPNNSNDYSNESKFYYRFKTEMTKEFTIYYSLKLITPDIPMREIDFLIISPNLILCIELKNGKWRYRDSKWEFYNRRIKLWESYVDKPYKDPIDQILSARKILQNFLNNHNTFQDPVPESYFKTCIFFLKNDSADFSHFKKGSEKIIGKSVLKNPKIKLASIIHELEDKTLPSLDPNTLHNLHSIIRLNLNFALGIQKKKHNQESEMIALSKEQYSILTNPRQKSRSIVLGVPGSGKTIVALEQANRLQLEGVKTLFLSTRTLLTSVQDQISNWDNITVISIEKNSSTNMLSNLKKEHFEFVILDSSEEYLDPQLVEKLDLLLEGGWKDGSWLIMGDLSSSIILADYQISIERIKIFALKSVRWLENIRTPKKVYEQACILGRKEMSTSLLRDITGIQYASFENTGEFYQKLEWAIHFGIRELKIDPEDIMIISLDQESKIDTIKNSSLHFSSRLSIHNFDEHFIIEDKNHKSISIACLDEFLGREAKYVIVIGFRNFNDPIYWDSHYQALTRCTKACTILFPIELKSQLVELLALEKKKKVSTYKPDSV